MAEFFLDTLIGNGSTDVNLVDHDPSHPFESGVTDWEYTGDPDDYFVPSFGGILAGPGVSAVARLNAPFNHTDLQIWSNLFHLGVDDAGHGTGFALFVPDTAIGSFDNRAFLRVGLDRSGAGGVTPRIVWHKADGTTQALFTGPEISFPLSSRLRLIATVQQDPEDEDLFVVSVATADAPTGTDVTVHGTAEVPAELLEAGHTHIGAIVGRQLGSAGIVVGAYHVTAPPVPVEGVDSTGVVPFPFRFGWPQQEVFSFLTGILTSEDGQEQRVAHRNRQLPRRIIRGTVLASERDEAHRMMALLFGRNTLPYGVPLWFNSTPLREAVGAGVTVIPVDDATGRDLGAGRLALLWSAFDSWEPVVILSATSNTVTLEAPTENAWPARATTLLPLRMGRLDSLVEFARYGAHKAEYQADFLIDAVDSLAGGTSDPIGVPAEAAKIGMVTQPDGAINAAAFTQQPVVRLLDAFNNPVSTAGVSITAAISAGVGTLGGTLTAITDEAGLATFTNLELVGAPGSFILAFESGTLAPGISNVFDLEAGTGNKLLLTTQPDASVESTIPLVGAGVVQLADSGDTPLAIAGIPVTVTIASGGGTLSGTTTQETDAGGEADLSPGNVTITGPAGARTLKYDAPGYQSVTSDPVDVTPHIGEPDHLTIEIQPPAEAESGVAFTTDPVVQLRDEDGNPVVTGGVDITVTIASGGGTLGGDTTVPTEADGTATFTGLSITGVAGPRTLQFSAGVLTPATSEVIDVEEPA